MLKIKLLSKEAKIPCYAKKGDAGFDLITVEDVVIKSGQTVAIKTGLAFEIPMGFEVQIRPRSGISLNGLLCSCNGTLKIVPVDVILGTVDSGYRGEIGIITRNNNDFDIKVLKGTKLAQGVINKIETFNIMVVSELSDSERNKKGFGSTGTM